MKQSSMSPNRKWVIAAKQLLTGGPFSIQTHLVPLSRNSVGG